MANAISPIDVLASLQDREAADRVAEMLAARLDVRHWRMIATVGTEKGKRSMIESLRAVLDHYAEVTGFDQEKWRGILEGRTGSRADSSATSPTPRKQAERRLPRFIEKGGIF